MFIVQCPIVILRHHSISEQQLQHELDLPRGRCCPVNGPARGAVVVALEHDLIGVRKIGVIENIVRGSQSQWRRFSNDPGRARDVIAEKTIGSGCEKFA